MIRRITMQNVCPQLQHSRLTFIASTCPMYCMSLFPDIKHVTFPTYCTQCVHLLLATCPLCYVPFVQLIVCSLSYVLHATCTIYYMLLVPLIASNLSNLFYTPCLMYCMPLSQHIACDLSYLLYTHCLMYCTSLVLRIVCSSSHILDPTCPTYCPTCTPAYYKHAA